LSDYRYQGVIHLVSAADGAEKFYTLENNQARYEDTPEKGKVVDINLRNAWIGHHSHIMIDNPPEGGFEKKTRKYILSCVTYSRKV